jgi:hypothetical protein
MAFGRASNSSARTTPGSVAGPFDEDRTVDIFVTGPSQTRIGFTEADVTSGAGFPVPPLRMFRFVLAAGDELWLSGDGATALGRVNLLITKAV